MKVQSPTPCMFTVWQVGSLTIFLPWVGRKQGYLPVPPHNVRHQSLPQTAEYISTWWLALQPTQLLKVIIKIRHACIQNAPYLPQSLGWLPGSRAPHGQMSGQQSRSSGALSACMHQASCGPPLHVSASTSLLHRVVTMLLLIQCNPPAALAVKNSTLCSSPPQKLPMPSPSDTSCSVQPPCSCCSSFAELSRGFVCSGSDPVVSDPTPTTSGCCCYKES